VEDGGSIKGCRQAGRLLGYWESILHSDVGVGGAVTVDGLKGGRYDSVFITGTSVCIAAVSGVKWLVEGSNGQVCGGQQYSEASIQRVEAMRLRMLATLDRHLAEDDHKRATNGI